MLKGPMDVTRVKHTVESKDGFTNAIARRVF